MSLLALLLTAGSLGLLGGVHCIAMCSGLQRVAIHGLRPGDSPRRVVAIRVDALPSPDVRVPVPSATLGGELVFHAARLAGYGALGALIGGGSSVLRWGADAAPLFRPVWGSLNAALLALGLALLVLGRQPAWIDALGQRIWSATGAHRHEPRLHRPLAAGAAWALLPCGLLYSALAVAVLASDPLRGALVMIAFGAGTAVNLLGVQSLLRLVSARLGRNAARIEAIGIRMGGALLAAMATAALVALALGQPHPFCGS